MFLCAFNTNFLYLVFSIFSIFVTLKLVSNYWTTNNEVNYWVNFGI